MRVARLIGTLLLATLASACAAPPALPPASAPARPAPVAARACVDARTNTVVQLTNGARAQAGLRALATDARLQQAAQAHADDMARGDFMAHEGSDGSLAPDRVDRTGYHWREVAENVAAGYPDAASVHVGWMGSPGHRDNILDPGVRHVGVGYASRPDASLHWYWVTVFGDTKDPRVPTPSCG